MILSFTISSVLRWPRKASLDEAEAQFKRALEIDPADSEVRGHLAGVLRMKASPAARVPPA